MIEDTREQHPNSLEEAKASWLRPYQFKPGQSGNPTGRAGKGKSLKEYAKEMLAMMTDEERQEYLKGINKDVIWEMAEGKPLANTDITTLGKALPAPILNVYRNDSDQKDNSPKQED